MGNRNDHDDDEDEDGEDYPRRFSSDYDADESEFDAQEEDEPRRGLLAFVIALGILLIVSTVIWNAYRQGVREGGRDGTPRITAEGPVKIAPEDPGGATVPGQDVAVYDEIEGAQTADAAAPDAAPPVESPRTPDAGPAQVAAVAPVKPAAPAGGPALPAAAPVSAGPIAFARGGPFVAQIAALRSQEAADAEWSKVSRVAPDLFKQAQKDIQRADLGAKGVFYRLRAGSFASRDAADAFCDQLQATGQGCIVAAR